MLLSKAFKHWLGSVYHLKNLNANAANTRTMPIFTMSRSENRSLKNNTSTPTTTAIKTST